MVGDEKVGVRGPQSVSVCVWKRQGAGERQTERSEQERTYFEDLDAGQSWTLQ